MNTKHAMHTLEFQRWSLQHCYSWLYCCRLQPVMHAANGSSVLQTRFPTTFLRLWKHTSKRRFKLLLRSDKCHSMCMPVSEPANLLRMVFWPGKGIPHHNVATNWCTERHLSRCLPRWQVGCRLPFISFHESTVDLWRPRLQLSIGGRQRLHLFVWIRSPVRRLLCVQCDESRDHQIQRHRNDSSGVFSVECSSWLWSASDWRAWFVPSFHVRGEHNGMSMLQLLQLGVLRDLWPAVLKFLWRFICMHRCMEELETTAQSN